MKKIIIALIVCSIIFLSACNQADRVSRNISKEADNFNVMRHLVAINMRNDTVLFEIIGNFSISNSNGELVITMKVGEDLYKKHFIYINPQWTAYTIEDISGADVSPYHWEINIQPQMIQIFEYKLGS